MAIKKKSTEADVKPVVKPVEPDVPVSVPPATVKVTSANVADDSGALTGHFCRVVAGEHEGRYGVYLETASVDEKSGLPDTILVRTRDDDDMHITVNYADVVPADPGGR